MKNMIIDGITYLEKRDFNAEEIKDLFESVSWMSANYSNRLVKAFKKAGTVIVAMDGEKIVGLIEVVDDGELNVRRQITIGCNSKLNFRLTSIRPRGLTGNCTFLSD